MKFPPQLPLKFVTTFYHLQTGYCSHIALISILMNRISWGQPNYWGKKGTYSGCRLSFQASEFGFQFQLKQFRDAWWAFKAKFSSLCLLLLILTVSIAFGASDHTLLEILPSLAPIMPPSHFFDLWSIKSVVLPLTKALNTFSVLFYISGYILSQGYVSEFPVELI